MPERVTMACEPGTNVAQVTFDLSLNLYTRHRGKPSMIRQWSDAPPQQWGILPLRFIVGFGFLAHGWAKLTRGPENLAKLLHVIGTPFPAQMAWVVTTRTRAVAALTR
jgi:hypothetical protein